LLPWEPGPSLLAPARTSYPNNSAMHEEPGGEEQARVDPLMLVRLPCDFMRLLTTLAG